MNMNVEQYKNVIFVAIEEHMIKNYSKLTGILERKDVNLQYLILPTCQLVNKRSRFFYGKEYIKKLKEYVNQTLGDNISESLIIYSNAEGFVLNNKRFWMPRLFNCKEVMLEHGLVGTSLSKQNNYARRFLNFVTHITFGFYLFGAKFGEISADLILVLGNQDKEKLRNYWKDKRIIVAGNLLKPEPNKEIRIEKKDNSCLLLLQDITVLGFTEESMVEIYSSIIRILSRHYNTLLVRKHPKMSPEVYSKIIDNRTEYITSGSLDENIMSVDRVYAIGSAALIDAAILGKEIVSIRINGISDGTYKLFNKVVPIDSLEEYIVNNRYNDQEATLKSGVFDECSDCLAVVNQILSK